MPSPAVEGKGPEDKWRERPETCRDTQNQRAQEGSRRPGWMGRQEVSVGAAGTVRGGEGGEEKLGKRERGLLKTSQCITQNVRVYSFILGIAGTENPAQKCHRLSCLITCCLLTPSLQGAWSQSAPGPPRDPETENIPISFLVPPQGLKGGAPFAIHLKVSQEPQSDPSYQAGQGKGPIWS